MFPMSTQELVRAEQSSRLEGFRRWSRRHPAGAPDVESPAGLGVVAEAGTRHHRRGVRPVLGR